MGLHGQDTAELVFEDCRVPVANILGEEGKGFYYIMQKFQTERLCAALMAQAAAEAALAEPGLYQDFQRARPHVEARAAAEAAVPWNSRKSVGTSGRLRCE